MQAASAYSRAVTGFELPDWRRESAYLALIGADVSAFVWEWLRRTSVYQRAWEKGCQTSGSPHQISQNFGLEELEDPALAVPHARPVWSHRVLPDILTACVTDFQASRSERIDLRLLADLVTIVIGHNEMEHLLFSDGRHFLRIDIVEGTLIGCPSSLTYLLKGLTRLQGPIASLDRLARLVRAGSFEAVKDLPTARHHRRILELRAADALADGCDQQSIARAFFGERISEKRWRIESPSYRRQVQRLVASARARARDPFSAWFGEPDV